jgi:hypothetical protein
MLLDNKTIEQARNADIIAFLEKYNGFIFTHQSGAYRCQQHKSLAIKADRRSFYWHSKGIGGFGVLDFLTKVENIPFRDAVEVVTGTTPQTVPQRVDRNNIMVPGPASKTLILPEKSESTARLYDYLCNKRSIDHGIVDWLIQKEMLYEDRRGNVIFIGYDEHKKPRFASLRGTHGDCSFRGDCAGSDKRYGFSVAAYTPYEVLYIFESPIDLMSHAGIERYNAVFDEDSWQDSHRLSLAGTSDTALPFFLNKHKDIKYLVFCLDNDPAGREAAVNMARKYADKGYRTRLELPENKDWNEDLQQLMTHIQAVPQINTKNRKGEFNDR